MILDIVVVVIVVVDVVVETIVVGVKVVGRNSSVVFEHCCTGEFHINVFFLNIVKSCYWSFNLHFT